MAACLMMVEIVAAVVAAAAVEIVQWPATCNHLQAVEMTAAGIHPDSEMAVVDQMLGIQDYAAFGCSEAQKTVDSFVVQMLDNGIVEEDCHTAATVVEIGKTLKN